MEADGASSTANCCICGVLMYHFNYLPMSMRCHCVERVCAWCVEVGKITQCPICRKVKRNPLPDQKWKRRQLQEDTDRNLTDKCLGCNEELEVAALAEHEKACVPYRDYLDRVHMETFHLYRDKANAHETEVKDLTDRMTLQENEIEDLEDAVEGYKIVSAVYEAEKRVYAFEQQSLLGAITRLTKPLATLGKRLQDIQTTVENLKLQVKESRENHRIFANKRRRLGLHVEVVHDVVSADDIQQDQDPLVDQNEDLQAEVADLISDAIAHGELTPTTADD